MEQKHNTGLRAVPFYPGAAGILAPDGVVIGHALGSTRSERNARLWAAAPELLGACEAALEYIDNLSLDAEEKNGILDILCAATNKAADAKP